MRTKSSILNTITSLTASLCSAILGIIAQTLFLKILNVEYLGVNGLFTNIISMLSIAELGIGNAIIVNLYKPIFENNIEKIKSLMHFYKKAYNIIALIVLVIGLILVPFLGYLVGEVSIDINITIIYLLFLFSTVSSYLLIYKRSILYADQKNYILNCFEIGYLIIYNTLQIIILYLTKNYYLYLSVKIICQLIENIIVSIYVNKKYSYLIDKNYKKLDKETEKNIFSKVKALIFHKVASFVIKGTDNIIISTYLNIKTVGLYSSYQTIINSVNNLFSKIISSTSASIGNLLVEEDSNKIYKTFNRIRFLNFWLATFSSTCLLVIMQSFIKLWIGEQFLLSNMVLYALVFSYFLNQMRYSYSVFKDAAGIWQEDKFVPVIESVLNIIISIALVKCMGLVGVFIGTILSSLVLWIYSYPKFVHKKLFKKNYKSYIKENLRYLIIFILIVITTYLNSLLFTVNNNLIQVIINTIVAILVSNLLLILIFFKTDNFKYFLSLGKKFLKINSNRKKYNKRIRLPLIKKLPDLYLNFDNVNYDMIIVTGITGSGKSYTTKKLSQEYQLPIVSFDFIYDYEKDREPNKLETILLKLFYKKYPQYKDAKKLANSRKMNEFMIKEIDDKFFDLVLNYIQKNNIKIIFDGACFCNDVKYEKFKNQRIVVKRTPFLITLYQRTKRCIQRSKGKKYRFIIFLKDIKYTIFHLKEWWYVINDFLSIIEINNNGDKNEKK